MGSPLSKIIASQFLEFLQLHTSKYIIHIYFSYSYYRGDISLLYQRKNDKKEKAELNKIEPTTDFNNKLEINNSLRFYMNYK